MILISVLAKKRPGQAPTPWPKLMLSVLVEMNWCFVSLPGISRSLEYRNPSNSAALGYIFGEKFTAWFGPATVSPKGITSPEDNFSPLGSITTRIIVAKKMVSNCGFGLG